MLTETIQNRKSTVKITKTKKETVTDYFSTMEYMNDYPVLPGKKDFMHVRGLLFTDIKKMLS